MNTQGAPIIDGLVVHSVVVDGNSPRWSTIDPTKYAYCYDDIRAGDFSSWLGKWLVEYVFLPFAFDPSIQQIIDDIDRRKLVRPNRATTETILDERSEYRQSTLGICGVIRPDTDGRSVVGYVCQDASGRGIRFEGMQVCWRRHYQIVAVVSRQPIS